MNFDFLFVVAFVLAALPAALFIVNLLVYRPLPLAQVRNASDLKPVDDGSKTLRVSPSAVSVLIPARNEERNIRATVEAVLANRGLDFEVIVLDDHSSDSTAQIVQQIAACNARVRLEPAPPLPAGWCGKQHACHVLSKLAQSPLLLFIDADVRLAPHALERMASFMKLRPAQESSNGQGDSYPALASGVPHQEVVSLSERLLLPLIHLILLGFLPMHAMRWTRWPAMSAGCGQLFIVRRDAYFSAGGHAAIRSSLHDGVMLPRSFRRAGFTTDLFDATDIASCRMYQTNGEVWRGLGKNATEGLAAQTTILPMTASLLGGQVLPFVLLAFAPLLSPSNLAMTCAAAALAYLPRILAALMFRQPWSATFLHPIGVVALIAIQWHALVERSFGSPSEWKGRHYAPINSTRVKPI